MNIRSVLSRLLGLMVAVNAASAAPVAVSNPPPVTVTTTVWNRLQKQNFTIDGHAAYVVVPKVAAPGKPWIWRTAWPDYHADVDIELVRNGYHIGYVEVVDMLGSDASLDIMDHFYARVRSQWGLAGKMALEPNSRGGLHAYRYAARHPERVACIYGEVPVMDFKSWPGKRPDAQDQWPNIMKYYGFASANEAQAYTGNPIDGLEPIARAKIPLRHIISLNDKVVPPEANTLEAQRRLRKLGHDIEVVAVKEGNECDGHHYPLPEVFQSVRFIMKHTHVLPRGVEYFKVRDGLANSRTKFKTERTGRVVFLGGSITFNGGWRDELMRYLEQRFPATKFEFVAAGIPSVGSNGHAFRLERDILSRGPVDLIFVEAAVNDGSNIPDKPDVMLRSMEGVVRHLRTANPMTDIVQMHFVMPEAIADYNAGKVPAAVARHEHVAEHYGCTSLNLVREVADRIKAGEFTWASGFGDVHPPPYGQRLYANSMMRMLDEAFQVTAKAMPHRIPSTMLDSRSYARGHYGKLEEARLGSGFKLDPCWRPLSGGTRDGFVNVPALVASTPGAEMTYDFEGTAIGLFLAAGPDTCVLEFSVDGAPFKERDTYTQWSGGLHLPWPMILADGLQPGKHTLTVRTTGHAAKRTALHIIHLLVN